MKWISISGLLLAAFWRSSASYQLVLEFAVCISAIMLVLQAAGDRKYLWVAGFAVIALFFNPIQPVAFSSSMFLPMDVFSMLMFLISLAVLKRKPRLSVQSITSRAPRTQAL